MYWLIYILIEKLIIIVKFRYGRIFIYINKRRCHRTSNNIGWLLFFWFSRIFHILCCFHRINKITRWLIKQFNCYHMFGIPVHIIVIITFAILVVWGYIKKNKWILYGGYGSGYHLQLSISFCIILVIGSKWRNSYLINDWVVSKSYWLEVHYLWGDNNGCWNVDR